MKPWLDKGEIQRISVESKYLQNLLALVDRDLSDAKVEAVSADRRFASAYGAALSLASYFTRKRGFRVVGQRGYHRTTFIIGGKILGKAASKYIDFFDLCRRKRNQVGYDFANGVSKTEVTEIIKRVREFRHGTAQVRFFQARTVNFPRGGEIQFADPIGLGMGPSLFLTGFAEFVGGLLLVIGLFTRLSTIPLTIMIIPR